MRLFIRVILNALAFLLVLPMISGITFNGNFVEAIGIGALFALMTWLVNKVAAWATAILGLATLGLALFILVPLWLFAAFWALPAAALMLIADILPGYLTVSGWGPAFLGGLVMFVIGLFTAEPRKRVVVRVRRDSDER